MLYNSKKITWSFHTPTVLLHWWSAFAAAHWKNHYDHHQLLAVKLINCVLRLYLLQSWDSLLTTLFGKFILYRLYSYNMMTLQTKCSKDVEEKNFNSPVLYESNIHWFTRLYCRERDYHTIIHTYMYTFYWDQTYEKVFMYVVHVD